MKFHTLLFSTATQTSIPTSGLACPAFHPWHNAPLGSHLCLPVGSMKFNEQRKLPEEWKIPLSHGRSYQEKPDGASPWIHYLCEIAFSPRKPMDLPPPSWHIQRNDQYQDENRARITLFFFFFSPPYLSTIFFLHFSLSLFPPRFGYWEIAVHK